MSKNLEVVHEPLLPLYHLFPALSRPGVPQLPIDWPMARKSLLQHQQQRLPWSETIPARPSSSHHSSCNPYTGYCIKDSSWCLWVSLNLCSCLTNAPTGKSNP